MSVLRFAAAACITLVAAGVLTGSRSLPRGAEAPASLEVFSQVDAQAPASLEVVGQFGGRAKAIAVAGETAYLAIGAALEVLDVGDPARPIVLGSASLGRTGATDLFVADGRAYLAMDFGVLRREDPPGLFTPDVTQPATPRVLSFLETPDPAMAVAARRVACLSDQRWRQSLLLDRRRIRPSEAASRGVAGAAALHGLRGLRLPRGGGLR